MDELTYRVVVHHEDPAGGLWAEVLDLPGCFASGDNEDELQEALAEAIGMYLSEPDQPMRVDRITLKPSDGDPSRDERLLITA